VVVAFFYAVRGGVFAAPAIRYVGAAMAADAAACPRGADDAAGFDLFWIDGKSAEDVRLSLNCHPAFSNEGRKDTARILGWYIGADITHEQYAVMLNCDCVIMSFLEGLCRKIVTELKDIARELEREMPVLALVGKRDESFVSSSGISMKEVKPLFDIVVTNLSKGHERCHMLVKLEETLLRRAARINARWEKWEGPKGVPYLWKQTDERVSGVGVDEDKDNQWVFFPEGNLVGVPTGKLQSFLRLKEAELQSETCNASRRGRSSSPNAPRKRGGAS
jgi:hypothetical protein